MLYSVSFFSDSASLQRAGFYFVSPGCQLLFFRLSHPILFLGRVSLCSLSDRFGEAGFYYFRPARQPLFSSSFSPQVSYRVIFSGDFHLLRGGRLLLRSASPSTSFFSFAHPIWFLGRASSATYRRFRGAGFYFFPPGCQPLFFRNFFTSRTVGKTSAEKHLRRVRRSLRSLRDVSRRQERHPSARSLLGELFVRLFSFYVPSLASLLTTSSFPPRAAPPRSLTRSAQRGGQTAGARSLPASRSASKRRG